MKNTTLYFFLFLACTVLFTTACKEDEAEIGEPFSKVEGITATDWILDEVFLVDEGNPSRPERNISENTVSDDDPLILSFEQDGTFTSNAPNPFFPSTGTWSFDNASTPTKIIFVDAGGNTTDAPLGGPTRISDSQLKINFTRQTCNIDGEEKAVLGYRLVFNRK